MTPRLASSCISSRTQRSALLIAGMAMWQYGTSTSWRLACSLKPMDPIFHAVLLVVAALPLPRALFGTLFGTGALYCGMILNQYPTITSVPIVSRTRGGKSAGQQTPKLLE